MVDTNDFIDVENIINDIDIDRELLFLLELNDDQLEREDLEIDLYYWIRW